MDEKTLEQINTLESALKSLRSEPLPEPTSTPQWAPDSHYAREMRKWNKPWKRQDFPKMLLRAQKVQGKNVVSQTLPERFLFTDDSAWLRACEGAERFNASNQRIVASAEEQEIAERDGWREGAAAALARLDGLDNDIAVAAAHRAYEDRGMSEAAKARIAQVEESIDGHVAEIPSEPRVKRAYKRKDAAV